MLTEIRDRSSGWLAWVIAAIIMIPMAFWGIQEYSSTDANPVVAEVAGKKIKYKEYENRLQQQQQRMTRQMGENVNVELLDSKEFKKTVLDSMVNRAMIESIADEQNYQISTNQLQATIKADENFQMDGEFNKETYQRTLLGAGYTERQYEKLLRQDERLQQVTTGFKESALVLPEEIRDVLAIMAEKRSFDLVTINTQNFLDKVTVSEDELNEYYQGNQAMFMQPEQMKVQYVELKRADIAAGIEIDDQALEEIYKESKDSYTSDEKRVVRHILLNVSDDNDQAQLEKANSIVADLKSGKDFAELAKQFSDDPGSAANGGDLGVIEKGQMVKEFEEASFSLAKNTVSEPVKSQFGYHIIEVTDVLGGEPQPFAEVKAQILEQERNNRAEDILIEQYDRMRDLAFEQPESLDGISEQLNLALKESGFFEKNTGTGIADSSLVRNAAFGGVVRSDEINSDPIKINDGHYVVLRKLDVKPEAVKPFADVKAQIQQLLTQQKATEAAAVQGDKLLAAARTNWQTAFTADDLKPAPYTISLLEPNRAVMPSIQEKVIGLQLGDNKTAIASVVDQLGNYNIVRLTKVDAGNSDTVNAQVKESVRIMLEQRDGDALMNTYMQNHRQQTNTQINEDLL